MSTLNFKLIENELETEQTYWSEKLAGELILTGLPLDFPGNEAVNGDRQAVGLVLDENTRRKLEKVCGNNESLIFTALVTSLKICLHKYTGNEDIIVGTTIHEKYADTACLNRFLALRDHVSGSTTGRQLLKEVKRTLADAYANQKYPFEKILGWTKRSTLFNVGVILDGIGNREHLKDLNNGLDVCWSIDGDIIAAVLEYNPGLFHRETVELFGRYYLETLRLLFDSPELEVSKFELLSADQKQQFIHEFNDVRRDYPRDKTIHQLFEAQVAETPSNLAVTFGNHHLTYAELNARANQLAHHLRRKGVEPGALIGIYLEHCSDMVVALLGTLKAGAAYVPLEPEHPRNRLHSMIDDAGLKLVLTQKRLQQDLEDESVTLICLDTQREVIATESDEQPSWTVTPQDLAYVIYTSGSTGKPKGIKIQHQALVNYIWWARDVYLGNEPLDFPLYSSLSFDLTVTSIYTPLISGRRIVVYRKDSWGSPLLDILQDDQVGVLKLTPSHLSLIKDRNNQNSRIQRLIVGGEALSSDLARQVHESFGGKVEIYNEYGPTEATVGCMIHRYDPGCERAFVPIGRPAANVQIYILDERGNPMAPNIVGELCIAGDGLAQGYLNRDALTAEKFVANPFIPGQRLYRSGDLARLLPEGIIEYLGRVDEQVKFHGYRVELNEIKSALNQHAQIRDSVVVVKRDGRGHEVMIAYYVSRQELEPGQLRSFLAASIIEETLPNVYVHLKRMPLTLNGKINYEGLPALEEVRQLSKPEYVAPQTPTEEILAGIWSEVLGVKRAGVEDNFFTSGGHSLLATQVISRVREAFQVEIGLRTLFEKPTVAALAQAIEELLREGQQVTAPPIELVSREGGLPLSFAQQRLWFLEQLNPGSAYNVPLAVRLSGALDVAALERSLTEIVRRHESLRTTFSEVEGEAVQVIHEAEELTLPLTDLSQLPEAEREAERQRLLRAEAEQAFDLERGPVLRASLLKLGAGEHLVLLTMHHIVSDGWSMGVLVREVSALYEAFSQGREAQLPPLPIQYADYAAWQRKWLQGAVLDEQLSYWKQQLGGELPVLQMPVDHARPAFQSYRGASESLVLSKTLSEGLQQLSRAEGATLFMTLLASLNLLLGRYTGQEDIVVGTPIAGRNRLATEALIGFFVNTLALRTDLSGNPTFRELLGRVRETAVAAHLHQDLPFEKLVEELQPERNLSQTPLFQVMLALQNAPQSELVLGELRLRQEAGVSEMAKFDLTLVLWERGGELQGTLNYNSELFERETIQQLLRHYEGLLAEIVRDPQLRRSELKLISAAEEQQVLVEWNETRSEYPVACIHELFQAQVARTPDAIAVVFGEEQVSYRELNRRANQLARRLKQKGVGPGVRAGVFMQHSPEELVALLAIVKAGGAYVPLEPAHPVKRLAFIISDAQLGLILTQRRMEAKVPASAAEVFAIDAEDENIETNLAHTATPEDIAYVIYTSGSTGEPKGVSISHRALVNYVWWAKGAYLQNDSDGFALYSSLAFDLTVTSIYVPLISGNKIVIHLWEGDEARHEPPLSRILSDGWTSVLKLTPSHLSLIKEWDNRQTSVKRLIVGGEALGTELTRQVCESFGGQAEVFNEYGPTEATVGCMIHQFDAQTDTRSSVPIGGPAANVQLYVLDEWLQPTADNVTGELYIAGDGLAQGYLNRPDLTAERFIANPFTPGERMYRSGDLCRRLPNRKLEYLGRQDEQVKFHGYRVELNEIRWALKKHPQIRDSVVVVTKDQNGYDVMIAYYVSRQELDVTQLRASLSEVLIEGIIPNFFVHLHRLPLTLNGKVNYEALPTLDEAKQKLKRTYTAPATPPEEILVGIWSEVLGVKRVGVYDNFFDLGGHSLLATQVISRVREAFQVEVGLRTLFEKPTVAALAQAIEESLNAGRQVTAPPIELVSREGSLPLSFAQQRLWFLEQFHPGSAYNVPLAVVLSGELDVAALERSLTEIVRRHESLRTTFSEVEGEAVQVIHEAEELTLPLTDLSAMPEAERAVERQRLQREEAERAFDLERGPVLRVRLVKLAEQEHLVLFTMHHIVSDGWSMGVLVREVSVLYEAYSQGREAQLPPLPIQYADYAAWQREWLQGEVLDEQLSYWKKRLGGELPVLQMPVDHARPAFQSYRGASESLVLSKTLSEGLEELSRREGATLFMTLLASLNLLLGRYTGQEDIVVGTPIAGRNRLATEGLIGFFVNTLALRTDLSGNPTFRELLGRVRETAVAAHLHQDLPFEKLVEELQPERNLSQTPLFQVMLVLQNAPQSELALGELRLRQEVSESETAKFDLTLVLWERDGELQGTLNYNTELFERETIQQLLRHYEGLLAEIVRDPQLRRSELKLLTPAEESLLVQWSARPSDYPRNKSVHKLFEEQAAHTPEAIAVVCEDEQLTYRQLNQRANQLAHYLRSQGVGAESLVGILMERSVEMVVALLGTLKAGGAYLPLDPSYPASRLDFMISDTKPAVLITQQHLRSAAPAQGVNVLCLDTEWAACADQPTANLNLTVLPEQLAYVMYTSGSTGMPKGVAVCHQGIVRLVIDSNYVRLDQREVLLQYAPISFDAATFEIWGSLLNGARLVVMKAGQATLEELGAALVKHQVTTLWLTASLFHVMVEEQLDDLRGVRQMLAGGDVLGAADVRKMLEKNPASVVINGYGPTENTTFTCCRETSSAKEVGRTVPIGKPIGGTQVYVLDDRFRAVPVGVAGELLIGGDGLARGYWKNADLTAERFVPRVYSPAEAAAERSQGKSPGGVRLYRTGDQVKWKRNGELEFLGRRDQQVKVLGHRIELGEIESALVQHWAVRDAVLIAREDGRAGKRLIAYVVAVDGMDLSTGELRSYLREKLPEYMLPSVFVMLEKLPLSPNGKVDRAALPEPLSTRDDMEGTYVAPRTRVEEALAGIWCQVLRLDQVGIYDNFFDLGGHSLLATRVIARIRQLFNVDLPLRDLFELPELALLSERVETAQREVMGVPYLPMKTANREEQLPLSFAQQRLWFLDRLNPGSASLNVAAAMRVRGPLRVAVLEQSLNEITRRHESLRTSFPAVAGNPHQLISPPRREAIPVIDLSHLDTEERQAEVQRLTDAEAHRAFDLSRGPLVRVKLLRLADQEHVVLLTMHHIISDGWSLNLLAREIGAVYAAYSAGDVSPLPELAVQYADYAVWQRESLQGEVLEKQLAYWLRQLSGELPVLALPSSNGRASHTGDVVSVQLSEVLSHALKRLSRRQGVTLFTTMLSTFFTLLHRYSGQDDIIIGSPVAHRSRPETEPLIGCLINTLALRANLEGNPPFHKVLEQVQEKVLAAHAHQDVSYELIVDVLRQRYGVQRPLFDVWFYQQEQEAEAQEIAGLEMLLEEVKSRALQFRLVMGIVENEQGLKVGLKYNVAETDPEMAAQMLQHYTELLQQVTSMEDQGILDIKLGLTEIPGGPRQAADVFEEFVF